MILFLSFLLLVVAPALLLWMGRFIAAIRIRDRDAMAADAREAEQASVGAWYRRPMLPAFAGQTPRQEPPDGEIAQAGIENERAEDEREWFLRPMAPLIDWSALRRTIRRRRRQERSVTGNGSLT